MSKFYKFGRDHVHPTIVDGHIHVNDGTIVSFAVTVNHDHTLETHIWGDIPEKTHGDIPITIVRKIEKTVKRMIEALPVVEGS